MQIAIIGLGGVGGYFGYKLAHTYSNQEDTVISFVSRNPTYDIVCQKGLLLISPENERETSVHPHIVLEHVQELNSVDLVLICVKEYDLENVCRGLKPIVQSNTVILPLMNGVDIYERIRTIIHDGIVLPSCVYVASHIKERGIIVHQGKPGTIHVGKDPQSSFLPDDIIVLFNRAEISIQYQENVLKAIWEKFIFIASFGLVSGRYNKTIGQILESPELKQKASFVMEEIRSIADHKGFKLHPNFIDLTFKKAAVFPYHTPTSLQLDIQSKKPKNELALFAGPILKYGKEWGLAVKATEEIYLEINQIYPNDIK